MNKLLIATHNPAKLNDISRFLTDIPYDLVSLDDVGISEDVEEDQPTFKLNAIKKAKFFCEQSGLATLSDDSGMEVDYLDGKPGVFSKRWAGDTSDEAIVSHTLKQLEGVPIEKRGAQFRVVIAYAKPSGEIKTAEGITRGIIAEKAYSGKPTFKFPYNQILFLPKLNKYYHDDELTDKELLQYNHRRIALEKLKKYFIDPETSSG